VLSHAKQGKQKANRTSLKTPMLDIIKELYVHSIMQIISVNQQQSLLAYLTNISAIYKHFYRSEV